MSNITDNWGSREGPYHIAAHTKTINVPAKNYCGGCRYFRERMTVHRLMGPNEYLVECTHPEAWNDGVFFGSPRPIGREQDRAASSITPSWCPFLQQKTES